MTTTTQAEPADELEPTVRVTPFSDPERRLFIGIYPGGIVFADRWHERRNDYARLAFLAYATLQLAFQPDCTAELRTEIEQYVRELNLRPGQRFQTSATGQTVLLGSLAA